MELMLTIYFNKNNNLLLIKRNLIEIIYNLYTTNK